MLMTFGKKIRGLRLRQRLTREQVCSILAWPLGIYIDLEEDRIEPSEDALYDFVNLYGVDRKFLLDQSSKPKSKIAHIKPIDGK
jgi:transcriptional regulator with XRE-family HTH domain